MTNNGNERYFAVAYYPDIVLMHEMLSFTGAIAVVTLTSSSKTARQHVMHVRQLSYSSVKLRSSSVRTYGYPVAPILILLIITYGAWCRIVCIRHQSGHGRSETMPWLTLGVASCRALWTMPLLLMIGVRDLRPEWMKREAILNTCCNTRTLLCRKTA